MSNRLDLRTRQALSAFAAAGLARSLPRITDRRGVGYRVDDRPVIGFCSNDYLGLANDPQLTSSTSGSGAMGSRLVCGDLPEHRNLEGRLAELAETDDAVFFPSGFQLNVGVLPAVLDADDLVFSDALNHASLIDGLRLARPRPTILPHRAAPPLPTSEHLSWWVTESTFSMDGDAFDAAAAARHLAAEGALYLDEAHAFGLFAGGRGLAHHHHVAPTLLVGTLGKAYGCAGAFVAATSPVCHFLRTRARSFVFTTGTFPPLAERVQRAIDLVSSSEGDALRRRLWQNSALFAQLLHSPATPHSPIFPLVLGDNRKALDLAQSLLARGWHVQAIRPPTVPEHTARLRITVTSEHTPEQIEHFVHDLELTYAAHDLPPPTLATIPAPSPRA